VYLPAEKIVLTGDVLESGVPIMRSAYPAQWLSVLEAIRKLDWNIVIPGHGGIQRNRDTLNWFNLYLQDLVTETQKAVAKGDSEDQAVRDVDLSKYSKMPDYNDRNADAIRRTYAEVTPKFTN
jgi:glyoxylase-like metal-dependent hydrolase (beta-lactamase superfamily II)